MWTPKIIFLRLWVEQVGQLEAVCGQWLWWEVQSLAWSWSWNSWNKKINDLSQNFLKLKHSHNVFHHLEPHLPEQRCFQTVWTQSSVVLAEQQEESSDQFLWRKEESEMRNCKFKTLKFKGCFMITDRKENVYNSTLCAPYYFSKMADQKWSTTHYSIIIY